MRTTTGLAALGAVAASVPLVRRLLAASNTQIHRSTPRPAAVTPPAPVAP